MEDRQGIGSADASHADDAIATVARPNTRSVARDMLGTMVVLQTSLLDGGAGCEPGLLGGTVERKELARGAWIDVRRSWLAHSDDLFERLVETVPWRAERRPMYERIIDVPRLLCFYEEGASLPAPELDIARAALDAHYASELNEPFRTAGLCLYRDGRDSVAWHGDRIGRRVETTVVAIVSLGAERVFALRPRGGGPSLRYELGRGDLFVMGGTCQRTWEHCVPKTSRALGARLSIQFRPRGVR